MIEWKNLGDVCTIVAGQSPPSSTYNQKEMGMPFFQGKADFGEIYPKVRFWCTYPVKIALPGDILISVRAPVGPTNINNIKSCIGRGLSAIRPGKNLDHKFLLHYLRSIENKLADKASGSTFSAITQKDLKAIPIPLPPLETQKKIAAIMDAADEFRQKTKALIDKYDELAKSLFLEMFRELKGERKSLSSFCEINPKKSEISYLSKEMTVSFVPMSHVSEKGELNLRLEKTLSDVWNGFTYYKEHDVVFAKITPCMENGKGAIMRGLKNGYGFGTTEFLVLRPINGISTPEWIYYLTALKRFRKEAEVNMTGSAGQKRVPKDFFDKYKTICPAISLQNQFAQRIQAIESQKTLAKKALEKSEELFSSLLQKAFNGTLINN